MSSPLDTEDWELSAHMDWVAKKKPIRKECSYCNGRGTIGGHFKSLEDSTDCHHCYNGQVKVYPTLAPKPEVPTELLVHMRKAFRDYFKK